jgi:hypothetical protein
MATTYVIENEDLCTKCGWSPFAGMRVQGRVIRVWLRGQLAYEASWDAEPCLAEPGSGRLLPELMMDRKVSSWPNRL